MASGAKCALKLYSVIDGGFVGKLSYQVSQLSVCSKSPTAAVETIIILDISGSMGSNVKKLAEIILPAMLQQLGGYEKTSPITLITFTDTATIYRTSVDGMAKLGLRSMDNTYMSTAVNCLKQVVELINPALPIRLLTLSDGALNDQAETVAAASALTPLLAGRVVSSRAVRYFTSSQQPDTRGLASVLQLNTTNSSENSGLVDIDTAKTDDATTIATLASLIEGDGLDFNATIVDKTGNNIQILPWDSTTFDKVRLTRGDNIFWFKSLPSDLSINGEPVDIEQGGPLTFDNYGIISAKLQYMVYRLKTLKIVHSKEAVQEIANAKIYLEKWVKSMEKAQLPQQNGAIVSAALLRNRMELLKNKVRRQVKTVFQQMEEIINQDNVHVLNSAQQANYLRQTDGGKLSRALARRGVDSGLDFTQVLRDEVKKMHENLNQLREIDDSGHFHSFYSLATTLTGIKAVCEFYEDGEVFESLNAMDILQMVNVVGIACQSKYGDYPDPMTWRIEKIFHGCYISVSDLIVAFEQSGNEQQRVTVPQTDEAITAVVPYFEDERIQRFLQKYAPNMLDYICSIGMRNVLAGVPKTYLYTLASGVWKMAMEVNKNRLEVAIVNFFQLVKTYNAAIGDLFKDIIDCINKEQLPVDGKLMSFYLGNNGVQNLIGPMCRLAQKNRLKTPILPRILRALYSYEIYLAVRKALKNDGDDTTSPEAKIRQLCGISFPKYGTPVGKLFEENAENPQFYSDYHLNVETLNEIKQSFRFVDYVTILPDLIQAAFFNDGNSAVADVKAMPKMDDASITDALGISYSLDGFKFFNILQAFLFDSQSKRSDEANSCMKIVDLGVQEAAEQFARNYVCSVYEDDYKKRLNEKTAKETDQMAEKLVQTMLDTPKLAEFEKLLGNGVTVKKMLHQIVNSSSVGFAELVDGLNDMTIAVPDRLAKIRVLLTGRNNDGEIVWNRGDVLFVNKASFHKTFVAMYAEDEWFEMAQLFRGKIYVYRNLENRHGHSNDKPSYWALGYKTLLDYFNSVSPAEQAEYEEKHVGCCGLGSKNQRKN